MNGHIFSFLAKAYNEEENKKQGEQFSHFINEFSIEMY